MSYSTAIPGLPGGPIITEYPIHVGAPDANGGLSFVPVGPQRPGRKAGLPRRSVQHGTGNPNSLARGDASFVRNDPQAAINRESMHFELDDAEVYVLVPLDEVTYQAADGAGPGNEHGFSAEMSENAALWADPTRRARVIHVAADLMGRCAARFGNVPIPERHWDFNWGECCSGPCDVQCGDRHHCPEQLMTRGLWDDYASQWRAAKADELTRMGQPQPTYAKPIVPPFLADPAKIADADQPYNGVVLYRCHRTYKAVTATPVLQTADPAKPVKLRPDVKPGDTFVGEYVFVGQPYQGDGRWVMTAYGSRVPMVGLTPKVDIKP